MKKPVFKIAAVVALLLSSVAATLAQSGGGCYAGQVIAPPQPIGLGQPVPGAIIRVCSSTATGTICSPLTPGGIFSDPGLLNPISNPFTADANGNYNFCAAQGSYLIQTSPPGTIYSFQATIGIAPNGSYTFSGVNTFSASNIFSVPQTFTEGSCSGAVTGSDILCANSALHAFETSLNNGAFVPVPQLAGDLGGTAASPTVAKIQGTSVTGTTGSGAVVLATTPTITTPNITGPVALTGNLNSDTNSVHCWNSDSGITRQAAAQFNLGTCTPGDRTGTLNLGAIGIGDGGSGNNSLFFTSLGRTSGLYRASNTDFRLQFSSTDSFSFQPNGMQQRTTSTIGWGFGFNDDTGISRDSAGVVDVGNGSQGDHSGTIRLAAIQGVGFQKQIFTSNGTFTIPAGITQVKVTLVGAGGAGGGASAVALGTGGGSGGRAVKYLSGLTPGSTITVTVGVGGTGVSAANGNIGTNSTISSGTQTITTVTAFGGSGGIVTGNDIGGAGAIVSTNGDENDGGSPGSAAATANNIGGNGGNSIFSGGGLGGLGSAAGNPATGAGSGGGGAGLGANNAGGAGANGRVTFEWVN